MQFTSVGCHNCPTLGGWVKDLKAQYPDQLVVAAFHMDYNGMKDPMGIDATTTYMKSFGFSGLPQFVLNNRKIVGDNNSQLNANPNNMFNEMKKELNLYPNTCGVAIETSYNASTRQLDIQAKLKSDIDGAEYRCLVYLVEDGISYTQAGVEGTSYTHNNVVRKLVSSINYGDKIKDEIVKDKEVVKTYTEKLDEGWNADNMRVIVSITNTLDGGASFTCNNTTECKVGGSVDYLLK